jgi:hypothetical protein
VSSSKLSYDEKKAQQLWQLSEKALVIPSRL